MAREIGNSKPKGFVARILGEQPTGLQKTFFWLMIVSLMPNYSHDGNRVYYRDSLMLGV